MQYILEGKFLRILSLELGLPGEGMQKVSSHDERIRRILEKNATLCRCLFSHNSYLAPSS
jgi:hypothetical protein